MSVRNDMPQMADDRVDQKHLAVLIEVEAPRIRRPVSDRLEHFASRMISPHAAVDFRPLRFARTGSTDDRRREDSMPTIKPAVRPPLQTVNDVVPHRVLIPTVEHHDRRPIRFVVAVLVWEEQQVRSGQRPHTAEADFDTRQLVNPAGKDRSLVRFPVAVRILKNHDAIALIGIEIQFAFGIGVVLGDPQPTALIGRDRDGLLHVRFVSEQLDAKTFRHFHLCQRFLRSQQRCRDLLRVLRCGNVVTATDQTHSEDRNRCRSPNCESVDRHSRSPSPNNFREPNTQAED